MRAGLNAVETKRAVHIASLARLKEGKFATTLNHHQTRRRFPATANAILSRAANANALLPYLHLERRNCRRYEIELPDGTNELAEGGMLEQAVNYQSAQKVSDDQ